MHRNDISFELNDKTNSLHVSIDTERLYMEIALMGKPVAFALQGLNGEIYDRLNDVLEKDQRMMPMRN